MRNARIPFVAVFLAASFIPIFGATAFGQSGIISIDHVSATLDEYSISYDQPIRFVIRLNNNSGKKCDIAMGWRLTSPDGATWDSTTLDSCGPVNVDHENLWLLRFNAVAAFTQFSCEGLPPDTVGFLGYGSPTSNSRQLPIGYNDTALAVMVWGLNESDAGKHLCIDSSWWDPGGVWKWVYNTGVGVADIFPEWHGLPGQAHVPGEGYCFRIEPDTRLFVIGDSADHITDHTPMLSWRKGTIDSLPQTGFEIAIGTDNNWNYSELWNPAPFLSTDTFVQYGGSALQDGQPVWVRVRLQTTQGWGFWASRPFRMNSVPSIPATISPASSDIVGSSPLLLVQNASDPQGDQLTYEFEGFHNTDCVAGPAIHLTGVASGPATTGGQITEVLAENCQYWWKVRAHDGFEYSDWSQYAQFLVNGVPEAPTAPVLNAPPLPDGKPVFELLPTLSWLPSNEPDPGDTVKYRVELSLFPGFSFAFGRDSLLEPRFLLTDSLAFGTHYWWRVTAKGTDGLSTTSQVKDFWSWKLGDLNHSHGADLSDLSLLIGYLTQTPRPEISPKLVGDLTGNCRIDLSDLSLMVLYMRAGGVQFMVGCE